MWVLPSAALAFSGRLAARCVRLGALALTERASALLPGKTGVFHTIPPPVSPPGIATISAPVATLEPGFKLAATPNSQAKGCRR